MTTLTLTATFLAACIGGDGIDWRKDYAKGMAEAKASGGAAMLFFTADW